MSAAVQLILLLVVAQQVICIIAQNKYHIAPYSSNWFEASEYCHRLGMRLAIVDTAEKHDAIVAEAKAEQRHSVGFLGHFGLWLGATDLGRSGVFIWHNTGERMRFSQFKKGEPSGGDEHCLVLYYWPLWGFNWTWNDSRCDTSLYAICENYEKDCSIQEF